MTDPIKLAIARAAAPKPRQGGSIPLPSGEVAMVDLPSPLSPIDAMAIINVITAGFLTQAPTQTEPASRILVPKH